MLNEILLAVIQAFTEYLPVSSSGHLALFSNVFNIQEGSLFLYVILHLASLFAVLIFTRKEIGELFRFDKKARRLWTYIIIATIPAVIVGLLFSGFIEQMFSSLLFLGFAFIFTGCILFATRYFNNKRRLNFRTSLFIGLWQVLALFPGISRSGMTISSGMFCGLKKDKAVKFAFLLFIPLVIGAFLQQILKLDVSQLSYLLSLEMIVAFIITFVLSLLFLNILYFIVNKGKFWMFSIYCFVIGFISVVLYFFGV